MRRFLICFLLLVLSTLFLAAQRRTLNKRFNAGIILGVNTSQINGDHLSGYDKFGFFTGVSAIVHLNPTTDFVVEMQYIKKGSKDPDQFVPGEKQRRFIALDYIEIPILCQRKVETTVGTLSLEGGIAYTRLFGFQINEIANNLNHTTFTSIQEDFNKNELALITGGGIFINKNLKVGIRFSLALTLLYKNENPTMDVFGKIPGINELRNLQLGLGTNYIF